MARPPLDWAVKGILPNLGVVMLKRGVSHRQCHNWIIDNGGYYKNRYNMVLYVSSKGVNNG
jgi:hypothetical protein